MEPSYVLANSVVYDIVFYVSCKKKVFPPEQEWQRGQPTPLHQITGGVCAKVVELLLQFMQKDHETQVRAKP